MLPDPQFLCIFTYKCAFRHSSVQFFDIRTSKSVPRPPIFSNILTSKCALKCSQTLSFCAFSLTNVLFLPQRRAIFRHQNFKKVLPDPQFLCIFTYKCASRHSGVEFFDIRTSKTAPTPSVSFCIFTSKCAFRHSGVQFLISPLSTYLRTRRFNRPPLD